jgi:hypothetical protein
LTNLAIGDKNLANQSAKSPISDAPHRVAKAPADDTAAVRPENDTADIERGRQLLAQSAQPSSASRISTLEQARHRLAELKSMVSADPQAAAAAHGRIDAKGFDAATARPAA